MDWDEPKAVSATLRNATAGRIEIVGVRKECGCTDATVSPSELGPGESAALAVTFDPGRGDGPVSKGVSVLYRTPPAPGGDEGPPADAPRRVDLRLTGEIVPQFRFEPAVPAFSPDDPAVALRAVTVRAASVEILRVMSGTPALSVAPDGGGFRLDYDPAAANGASETTLTVEATYAPAGRPPVTDFFFLPATLRGPPASDPLPAAESSR